MRLLRRLLPDGWLLAASDVSAAMLAQLTAGRRGHAPGVVLLRAAAGQLPLRAASLDLVTAFNCVHHFDLGRFPTAPPGRCGPAASCSSAPAPRSRTHGRSGAAISPVSPSTSNACTARPRSAMPSGGPAGSVVATRTFRHPRSGTAERLRAQAEGRHYSTFSLYMPEEFRASLATFLARLPGPEASWVDEDLLVVAGGTRRHQAEPHGPAGPAITDHARQIRAGRASQAPSRHPGGRVQITPIGAAAADAALDAEPAPSGT